MKIISPEKLQEKIGWIPYGKQQDIIDCFLRGERHIVVSAGQRSGKSMVCAFLVLLSLLSEKKEILVISPSYPLTDRVLSYVKEWMGRLFSVPVSMQSKPFPLITINWSGGRSYVEGKSAESPEQLLGKSYDLIVVDEASRIPRKIYEQYLYPRTGEKQGTIVLISTPLKKDWFYEEFLKAKETNSAFQFGTADNPHYPKIELEKLKKKLPKGIYDREFNAVFSDEITSIFPSAYECISPDLPRGPQPGHYYFVGLDLAKEEDFTAIALADRDTNEIVHIEKWQKLPYNLQLKKVLAIVNHFKNCQVIIDSRNIGAIFGEQLRAEGLWVVDWVSTGTISKDFQKRGSKERLVEKAMSLFESREIKIPHNVDLLDELSSYSYIISPSGNIRYGPPLGLHDDLTDALMMAVWNLEMRGNSGSLGEPLFEEEEMKALVRQLKDVKKPRRKISFI